MGPDSWHLWIDAIPRAGWANMAVDMALLERAEQHHEGWLRLYTWNPHCLSFGRHEPAVRRYDPDRIRQLALETVRRPTGGRAVWHAHELTYAVAAPWTRFGSPGEAYLEIHRLLGQTLADLGVHSSLAPRTRAAALDTGACFAQPVGGEVLVMGRKVIGSAQLRRGSALLQHGSILLQDEQFLVTSLMRSSESPADHRLGSTAELAHESGLPLSPQVVSKAVAQWARRRWQGAWELVTEPAQILSAASRHYSFFQSPSWTWAR